MLNGLKNSDQHGEPNYTDLQKSVDELVGKFGLKNTIQLIRQFSGGTKIYGSGEQRLQLITAFVIDETIAVFDLDVEEFYKSSLRDYREARMVCCHLLKKYTDSSYSRIGARFGLNKRQVIYYCKKCDEILALPQFYKTFTDCYHSLDRSAADFISKLN